MTERPHRFFIFSPKEVIALLLIGSLVAFLSFTLGLHYGKRLGGGSAPTAEHGETAGEHATGDASASHAADATDHDVAPRAEDLDAKMERAKPEAVDKMVTDALKKEIEKEGLALNEPKPTKLPEPGEKTESHKEPAHSAASPAKGHGNYAIQIASFPKLREAEKRVSLLKAQGLDADILEAQIPKMGTRYRVLIGSFENKAEANAQGRKWVAQKKISEFVLIPKPDNE